MTIAKRSIFLVLVASMCAQAQQSVDVVALIHQRDFGALEKHFNAIEASFERGETTEFALLDAYKPLYMRNDELSDDLLRWTSTYPKSYAAHLARGTYYRKLGEINRGTAFINDVPQSTISYMERVFGIAEAELTTALPLTGKPYLAVLNLLNIARQRGDDEAADRYLAQGNKLLPQNLLLRARYLDHLKPRWGGSYTAMLAFVARCKTEGMNGSDLSLLSAIINDDKGSTAEREGDLAEAGRQYKLALTNAEGTNQALKLEYLKNSIRACRKGLVAGVECQ